MDRLVALVDMDCFYCQVETRLNPSLKGKPMAVVQYNQWKGGGIIAVNYEARDRGVTRHMRGEEAKQHCPEIELVSVPVVRGKADLTKYRDAGREVINVICEFSECVQRASVDEAYIDLTTAVEQRLTQDVKVTPAQLENTFVVGYSNQHSNDEGARSCGVAVWLEEVYNSDLSGPELHRLATAAALVEQMRAAVFQKTGFRCSAGIAHNKILAKLVCGMHKPNRQTVLPMSSVPELYQTLPIKKVRNLGGKFGDDVVERLGITYMSELTTFTEKQLQAKYDDKTGSWLYNIAKGIDLDPVTPRLISKSIGCCKKFPGKTALATKQNVTHWLSELASEVSERLNEDMHMNKRKAQLLTIHFSQEVGRKDVAMSRSVPLPGYDGEKLAECAFNILTKHNSAAATDHLWHPPLKYLGLSAGKFKDYSGNTKGAIDNFFKVISPNGNCSHDKNNTNVDDNICLNSNKIDDSLEIKSNMIMQNNIAPQENSLSNKSKIKSSASFFEEYFKNVPEKILNCSPGKLETKVNAICKSNKTEVIAEKFNESKISKTSDFQRHGQNHSSGGVNDTEETWISLSEIFPDFESIDDSILNILPLPLQRKIQNIKQSKSKIEADGSSKLIHVSQMSSDSECLHTREETVLNINTKEDHQNLPGASSISAKESVKNAHVNDLLNKTSGDIFDAGCKDNKFDIDMEGLPERIDKKALHNQQECLNNKSIGSSNSSVNETDESWISPSEIFPDLDCIDESIFNILPSPLQRKINSVKNSNSELESSDLINTVEKSSDSECVPTRVETVALINAITDHQDLPSTSSMLVMESVHEGDSIGNDLLNKSSMDIFNRQTNKKEEFKSEACDKCLYCEKYFIISELQEHLDYHVALKLQEEFSRQPHPDTNGSTLKPSRSIEKHNALSDKKKRGRPCKKDASVSKKARTIVSFFSKASQ